MVKVAPWTETLSLTISTRDVKLINRETLVSVLPSHVKQLNYTVCYYSYDDSNLWNTEMIRKSWQDIPITFSISDIDRRVFLHTLPYCSSRLTIRSSLAKNISKQNRHDIYSTIDQIQIYHVMNLSDAFVTIGQCRRVRELTILATDESTTPLTSTGRSSKNNQQNISIKQIFSMKLSSFNRHIDSDLLFLHSSQSIDVDGVLFSELFSYDVKDY